MRNTKARSTVPFPTEQGLVSHKISLSSSHSLERFDGRDASSGRRVDAWEGAMPAAASGAANAVG